MSEQTETDRPTARPTDPQPHQQAEVGSEDWADDADARAALIGAVLWVGAAVLCVVASFQNLYAAGLGSVVGLHVDGWGTVATLGQPTRRDGTKFGVVLCVNAAIFLAAAVLMYLSTRADRRQLARIGRATALAATAFLVGSLLAMGMVVQSAFAGISSGQSTDELNKLVARSVQLQIGWLVWLGVIALVCSAIAFAAPVLGRLGQLIAGNGDPDAPDG